MFYYERRYLVVQDERPARLSVAAENRKQTCQRPMILWPHWPKVLPDSIARISYGNQFFTTTFSAFAFHSRLLLVN